jgi:hypothetical protein
VKLVTGQVVLFVLSALLRFLNCKTRLGHQTFSL